MYRVFLRTTSSICDQFSVRLYVYVPVSVSPVRSGQWFIRKIVDSSRPNNSEFFDQYFDQWQSINWGQLPYIRRSAYTTNCLVCFSRMQQSSDRRIGLGRFSMILNIGKVPNFDHVPNFDLLPRKADFLKNNENWRKPLGTNIHSVQFSSVYFSGSPRTNARPLRSLRAMPYT